MASRLLECGALILRSLRKNFAPTGLAVVFSCSVAHSEIIQCRSYPDGGFRSMQVQSELLPHWFLSTLHFDENGVAAAVCGEHLHFVSRSGRFVEAYNYDNGPDYFSDAEGLARFVGTEGLIGFVDTNLDVVIEAKFLCAMPFRDGAAAVTFLQNGDEVAGTLSPDGQVSMEERSDKTCTSKAK